MVMAELTLEAELNVVDRKMRTETFCSNENHPQTLVLAIDWNRASQGNLSFRLINVSDRMMNFKSCFVTPIATLEDKSTKCGLTREFLKSSSLKRNESTDSVKAFDQNTLVALFNRDWQPKLKILCRVVFEDDDTKAVSKTLSMDLLKLYDSKHLADITFHVDDKQFQAHKNVLITRSDFFQSMFTTDMQESRTGIVTIEDCNAPMFEAMLQFIYSDVPPWNIEEIAPTLLPVADRFLLPNLKQHCVNSIVTTINGSNVDDIIVLAHKFDLAGLKRRCLHVMLEVLSERQRWEILLEATEKLSDSDLALEMATFFAEGAKNIPDDPGGSEDVG